MEEEEVEAKKKEKALYYCTVILLTDKMYKDLVTVGTIGTMYVSKMTKALWVFKDYYCSVMVKAEECLVPTRLRKPMHVQ